MRLPPLVRLLRPGLAPTAAADVLAGAAFVGGTPVLPLVAATAGSVCLYAAGMGQNDLCDRERDRELHPHRPLVVRPDLASWAWLVVAALYAGGLALALAAGTLLPALAVAALSTLYNVRAKRHLPWGAIVLGAARACNLAIGLRVAGGWNTTWAIAYLLYIGGVTLASGAEDVEPRHRRRRALVLSFLPVLVAIGGLASLVMRPPLWGMVLVPLALLALSLGHALLSATRAAIMGHVFRSLLAIFLLHAAVLWGSGKTLAVLPIVACAAASAFLLLAAQSEPESSPASS